MSGVTLTKRDQELLNLVFLSFQAEPKVDYKRFAQLAGFTEGSAKTAWSVLKKKVLGGSSTNGQSAFKVRKPHAAAGKEKGGKGKVGKGKKGGKGGDGEDEEEEVKEEEQVKSEEEDEEDEVEEVQRTRKVKVEVIDD